MLESSVDAHGEAAGRKTALSNGMTSIAYQQVTVGAVFYMLGFSYSGCEEQLRDVEVVQDSQEKFIWQVA